MISPITFVEDLRKIGIDFFVGVPDSLLASFCAYVDDHGAPGKHVIAANEGNAVAIAIGYHLSTGEIGAVYLQNSGLGNTINPLTSLADPEVYGVPLLMIIGWRGEPGVADEPQHIKQGRITPDQLRLLEIPYWILGADSDLSKVLSDVAGYLTRRIGPAALLVRKSTFSNYSTERMDSKLAVLGREAALRRILDLSAESLIVSTTGKTSREVFELRVERSESQRDFLTVGGMGHAASIALGVALGDSEQRVVCLDGDGSMLMHLGAVPVIGSLKPKNFLHVLLNNGAHESVGGQPTVGRTFDFRALADASGYQQYRVAEELESLSQHWQDLLSLSGPSLLEVKIAKGSRPDLGRPTSTPAENKRAFIEVACR